MRKIRRGDEVIVISGRNKGQQGTVRLTWCEKIAWWSKASTSL